MAGLKSSPNWAARLGTLRLIMIEAVNTSPTMTVWAGPTTLTLPAGVSVWVGVQLGVGVAAVALVAVALGVELAGGLVGDRVAVGGVPETVAVAVGVRLGVPLEVAKAVGVTPTNTWPSLRLTPRPLPAEASFTWMRVRGDIPLAMAEKWSVRKVPCPVGPPEPPRIVTPVSESWPPVLSHVPAGKSSVLAPLFWAQSLKKVPSSTPSHCRMVGSNCTAA